MNSLWLRVALRSSAMILLALAVGKFWIDFFSSLRAEEDATAGGFVIDNTVLISHTTIVLALVGMLAFVFSFLIPRKSA